ncbi:hypothetical protein C7475_101194 [Chitinophaga sp. S165]|nr:hypothetical protein C7475_101194 [Chitinophaga sp. S165]
MDIISNIVIINIQLYVFEEIYRFVKDVKANQHYKQVDRDEHMIVVYIDDRLYPWFQHLLNVERE